MLNSPFFSSSSFMILTHILFFSPFSHRFLISSHLLLTLLLSSLPYLLSFSSHPSSLIPSLSPLIFFTPFVFPPFSLHYSSRSAAATRARQSSGLVVAGCPTLRNDIRFPSLLQVPTLSSSTSPCPYLSPHPSCIYILLFKVLYLPFLFLPSRLLHSSPHSTRPLSL